MKHRCNPGATQVQRGAGGVQAKAAYNMLIISRGARGAGTRPFLLNNQNQSALFYYFQIGSLRQSPVNPYL